MVGTQQPTCNRQRQFLLGRKAIVGLQSAKSGHAVEVAKRQLALDFLDNIGVGLRNVVVSIAATKARNCSMTSHCFCRLPYSSSSERTCPRILPATPSEGKFLSSA